MTSSPQTKRPDTRCNAVEPCPIHNPSKDQQMNAHTSITPDRDPLATRGKMKFEIDMQALRNMPMEELLELRKALHTVAEVLSALTCQPRFIDDREEPSAAALVLHEVLDFVHGYEESVVRVAEATKPRTKREAEDRGFLMLGYEAAMRDSLGTIAVMAAEAVREECRLSHGGRS